MSIIRGTQNGEFLQGTTEADEIYGEGGDDFIAGDAGDDRLDGGEGSDRILGGAGDDVIVGGAGADLMAGVEGDDELHGGAGDISISGGIGVDKATLDFSSSTTQIDYNVADTVQIIAGSPSATVDIEGVGVGGIEQVDFTAGSGADVLTGWDHDDVLRGGAGEDLLSGGKGDDLLDGGTGEDNVTFSGRRADYDITVLGDGSLLIVDKRAEHLSDGTDTVANVEYFHFADRTYTRAEVVQAPQEGVVLRGTAAGDMLSGADGNDQIFGEGGVDLLFGGGGDDLVEGGADGDLVVGGDGDDVLRGGDGDDRIWSDNGRDVLEGGAGNDILHAGDYETGNGAITGVKRLDGGDGVDMINLRHEATTASIDVDMLRDGSTAQMLADGSTFTNVEAIAIYAGSGNDRILGGNVSGDDLEGTSDYIDGGAGDDVLDGRGGRDYVIGGAGSDVVRGDADDVSILGDSDMWSAGTDTGVIDFAAKQSDIAFSVAAQRTTIQQIEGTFVGGFERVDFSSGSGDDTLTGGALDDTFRGNAGNDAIDGGGGNDTVSFSGNRADYRVERLTDGSLRITDLRSGSPDGVDTVANAESFGFADGVRTRAQVEDAWIYLTDFRDTEHFGEGAHHVRALGQDDIVFGGGGDDILEGGTENDQLYGEADDDILRGEAGDDLLVSGDGNDELHGGAGNDALVAMNYDERQNQFYRADGTVMMDGGDGIDVARFDHSHLDIASSIDMRLPSSVAQTLGDGSTFVNVEAIAFAGGSGDDVIHGGSHDDNIDGGAGDDLIAGHGRTAAHQSFERLIGGEGSDEVHGDLSSQMVIGDKFDQQAWQHQAASGADHGVLDLSAAQQGVEFSVAANLAGSVWIQNTEIRGFERLTVTGGDFADHLTGGALDDVLAGGAGNDVLEGLGGDDTLDGGQGDDRLVAGAGADRLIGGAGDDIYENVTATTTIEEVDGAGIDTVLLGDASVATYTLQAGIDNAVAFGGANAAIYGNAANNRLVGTEFSDTLVGNEGQDTLLGAGGSDVLVGGGGNDAIDGGDGDDVAQFSGQLTDYRFTRLDDGAVQVVDMRLGSADGADLLTNVEHVRFDLGITYRLEDVLGAVNRPPVASGDSTIADEDAAAVNLWSQLIQNDGDPDRGDAITIVSVDTTGASGRIVFDAATQTLA